VIGNRIAQFCKRLADSNLLDLKLQTRIVHGNMGNRPTGFIQLKLTDAARPYIKEPPDTKSVSAATSFIWGGMKTVTVKFCEAQFKEITGIRTDGPGDTAVVEYTWEAANLTPFGKADAEIPRSQSPCATREHAVSVRMQRYDDGWRMAQ
jgi:hypothetical protein